MKSHVGMAYACCPICLKEHTPEVLLHTRFEQVFENGTHYRSRWELCDEHKALTAEYLAFIEVRNQCQKLEDADRTGKYIMMERSAATAMLGINHSDVPLVFVEEGFIDNVMQRVAANGNSEDLPSNGPGTSGTDLPTAG